MQLSTEQLIEILQDKQKIVDYFNAEILIDYEKTRCFGKRYFELGGPVLTIEPIENDFYCYSAPPLKGLSAPKAGVVGFYPMESVVKNDFIIFDPANKHASIATERSGLSAQLCDAQGKILSVKIYYPGEPLPPPQTYLGYIKNFLLFFQNRPDTTTQVLEAPRSNSTPP